MRYLLSTLLTCCATALCAQTPAPRFIEVIVTDTVHRAFAGMDFDVTMPNPFDEGMAAPAEENPSEREMARSLDEAVAKAKATESMFLETMKAAGFTYRLGTSSTYNDYYFGTDKTHEVNTYRVELKSAADIERFQAAVNPALMVEPRDAHHAPPGAEAPRMMRKLFDQAKAKATALVAASGGKLGEMISAQEVQRNEGSILEQLFRMDKMRGSDEDALRMLDATETTSMAFRFQLLTP